MAILDEWVTEFADRDELRTSPRSDRTGRPMQRPARRTRRESGFIMSLARELRFAFVFDAYEEALHLYRDVFGLEVVMELDQQGGRG